MVGYGSRCPPRLRAVSTDVAVAWVGNIGSGVSWSFFFSFESVEAAPQVLVGVASLLVVL